MLIIRFLNTLFQMYYLNDTVTRNNLIIKDVNFIIDSNSKKNEGFIGFFDWLRKDKETIIGIRTSFFEHQEYNKFLVNLPYVNPTFDNKCMEIMFEDTSYNFDLSDDQDSTNNYVYKSDSGEYLFTFGLDNLTEQELNKLLNYCKKID